MLEAFDVEFHLSVPRNCDNFPQSKYVKSSFNRAALIRRKNSTFTLKKHPLIMENSNIFINLNTCPVGIDNLSLSIFDTDAKLINQDTLISEKLLLSTRRIQFVRDTDMEKVSKLAWRFPYL